jgi:hypothetical protein
MSIVVEQMMSLHAEWHIADAWHAGNFNPPGHGKKNIVNFVTLSFQIGRKL